MKRLNIDPKAADLIDEMAEAAGVTRTEYLHALINYAYSIHRRTGSWEVNTPFAYTNYDRRREGAFADRWF